MPRPKPTRKHDAADARLERALQAVARSLDAAGAPWTVIGGVAVIVRGVRRMTTDIDAVVKGDALTYARALEALAGNEIVPRIEGAEEFATASLVLLVRHEPTGVDIDLSFGWTSFEVLAIARSSVATFGRVRAPFARPQDLVVLKAVAGRPTDVEDATALLLMHPGIDVVEARVAVGELAALAEAPEMLDVFDAAVGKARALEGGGKHRASAASTKQARGEGVLAPRKKRKPT